jgi:hypothetical protein
MVVELALPAAFVILAAVVMPAFVALTVAANGTPGVPLPDRVTFVILLAFVILPDDILLETVLFITLPAEVVLPDFIVELPVWFPVIEVAAITDAAEDEVANIMPVTTAKVTPNLQYSIFSRVRFG